MIPTNTTTWVDQKYGRLLARQHEEVLSALSLGCGELPLPELRRSPLYLREVADMKIGYGNKRGIRVWFVCSCPTAEPKVAILTLDFDRRTLRRIREERSARAPIVISHHAVARLFERLRTNCWEDVRAALVVLSKIPPAPQGYVKAEGVTDFGRFVCESTEDADGLPPLWCVRTFLPLKR